MRWDGNRGQGHSDGEGDNAGILTPIINNRDTLNNPNTQTLITIVHLQWAININIRCPMNNIQSILNNSNNTCHKDHQHNHAKWQIYANCVRIKAIMIISANLQVTLWPVHKKPLTKDTHIVTKT